MFGRCRLGDKQVFAASSGGVVDAKDLTRRQAEWAEEVCKLPGSSDGMGF